jgi:hypothetical protein
MNLVDGSRLVAILEMFTEWTASIEPHFSLTGKSWRLHGRPLAAVDQERYGGEPDASGLMHDEILDAFPDLRAFAAMAGCDPQTGIAINMLEDARYNYRVYRGLEPVEIVGNLPREAALARACRILRADEIPLDEEPADGLAEALAVYFDAQRDRWATEARHARAFIEALPASESDSPRLSPGPRCCSRAQRSHPRGWLSQARSPAGIWASPCERGPAAWRVCAAANHYHPTEGSRMSEQPALLLATADPQELVELLLDAAVANVAPHDKDTLAGVEVALEAVLSIDEQPASTVLTERFTVAGQSRAAAIARAGGAMSLVTRAHALILRAWPCYIHYRNPDREYDFYHVHDAPPALFAELHAALAATPVENDSEVPAGMDLLAEGFPADEPPGALPKQPADPGLSPLRPELVGLALACDRVLPALVAALADDKVPDGLAHGSEQDARLALAELYDRYRSIDPGYKIDGRALVQEHLAHPSTSAALETRPGQWQWMCRIASDTGPGGVMGAGDGMPLRCFVALDDAKRWAVWQTDFSASLLGDTPRSDPALCEVTAKIIELDGTTAARFEQPGTGYVLFFVPYEEARESGAQHAL